MIFQLGVASYDPQLVGYASPLARDTPIWYCWSILAFEIGKKTTDGGYVASVASDREYAAYHQFGTVKMPARPFLPIKVDFATRTMTLTDFAWESLKPLLIRNFKQIISNEQQHPL